MQLELGCLLLLGEPPFFNDPDFFVLDSSADLVFAIADNVLYGAIILLESMQLLVETLPHLSELPFNQLLYPYSLITLHKFLALLDGAPQFFV